MYSSKFSESQILGCVATYIKISPSVINTQSKERWITYGVEIICVTSWTLANSQEAKDGVAQRGLHALGLSVSHGRREGGNHMVGSLAISPFRERRIWRYGRLRKLRLHVRPWVGHLEWEAFTSRMREWNEYTEVTSLDVGRLHALLKGPESRV